MIALTLTAALQCIMGVTRPGKTEHIDLDQAYGRITASTLRATLPIPRFNQSLMDGYALKSAALTHTSATEEISLRIVGEIPAGCMDIPRLKRGETINIMTGGALPPGADLVVPQEQCRIVGDMLFVPGGNKARAWIQKSGSELRRNQIVVKKGEQLSPEHLASLAKAGISRPEVFKSARAAILCTGSELIAPGTIPQGGQVIGANALQLSALLRQTGCTLMHVTTLPDVHGEISTYLRHLLAADLDIIITTGGMGPGKYDLLPHVFKSLDIEILYHSLEINPGKRTMLGVKNGILIFALPGPPSAVRILFNELIRPALKKIMGHGNPFPKRYRAVLAESVRIKKPGFQTLLPAAVSIHNGQMHIRRTMRHETANAILLLPPRRRFARAGEMVTYHSA